MGDVVTLVRVERDRDVGDSGRLALNELREPLQVGMCAAHGQRWRDLLASEHIGGAPVGGEIAEVILRINDEQVVDAGEVRFHGGRPSMKYSMAAV